MELRGYFFYLISKHYYKNFCGGGIGLVVRVHSFAFERSLDESQWNYLKSSDNLKLLVQNISLQWCQEGVSLVM